MDVKSAVKDQAKYPEIVAWFRSQRELDVDGLVLLADTIGEMSDQIYEHYRALCDLLKNHLQKIRRNCLEYGCETVYPDSKTRKQLAYVVGKACECGAVLPEKYEQLSDMLRK